MIRVGLIRLKDYEGWIKSLGYDREWIVQATQADLYRNLVIESAEAGMFSLPLTYDSYLVIINAVDIRGFEGLMSKLCDKAPVALTAYIGLGPSYPEAMGNLRALNGATEDIWGVDRLEETAAAHLDLDGYNRLVSDKGFHRVEELINVMLQRVKRVSAKHGGLAYYAGGDNIVCFIPCERLKGFLDDVWMESVKVGAGIALKPRDALMLAAQALDTIRQGRNEKVLVVRASP
jgi:GTP cyclohydrolase IIa